jgi:hypothetical protein
MQDSPRRSWLYACAALLWACSNDVSAPEGPTACYQDKVGYDCTQVISCRMRLGEPSLGGGDPIGACVERTTDQIASSPNGAAIFLTNFGRCRNLQSCDYRDCATSGAHGYGEMHRAEVTNDCQQKLTCEMSKGAAVCDVNNAVAYCVNETIGVLDSAAPVERSAYEAAFARCGLQIGCPYVDCVYGPGT